MIKFEKGFMGRGPMETDTCIAKDGVEVSAYALSF